MWKDFFVNKLYLGVYNIYFSVNIFLPNTSQTSAVFLPEGWKTGALWSRFHGPMWFLGLGPKASAACPGPYKSPHCGPRTLAHISRRLPFISRLLVAVSETPSVSVSVSVPPVLIDPLVNWAATMARTWISCFDFPSSACLWYSATSSSY